MWSPHATIYFHLLTFCTCFDNFLNFIFQFQIADSSQIVTFAFDQKLLQHYFIFNKINFHIYSGLAIELLTWMSNSKKHRCNYVLKTKHIFITFIFLGGCKTPQYGNIWSFRRPRNDPGLFQRQPDPSILDKC